MLVVTRLFIALCLVDTLNDNANQSLFAQELNLFSHSKCCSLAHKLTPRLLLSLVP
jgi:hypothetical protein